MDERFETILEPSDLWTVWDKTLKQPAMFGEMVLGGMSESEARAACELLNSFHQKWKRNNDELQAKTERARRRR